MPTRRQLIQKITLNASASSVIFSNIPQNYTDLNIVCSAREATATAWSASLRFNQDSSNNYSVRQIQGSGGTANSSVSGSLSYMDLIIINSSNATANVFGNADIYIPNYTASSNKIAQSLSSSENNSSTSYLRQSVGLWSNTSSINNISIFANSGNLAANSTFYLYGITQVPIIRGGEVSIRDGFKYHTFKSTASLQTIEGGDIEYMVVAGGGGGGGFRGGGGGAGGMLTGKCSLAATTNYAITIGGGGNGARTSVDNERGQNGSNSTFFGLTALGGGGGGGNFGQSVKPGKSGGSGGGAGFDSNPDVSGGAGTSGQGNNGGNESSDQGAGGGGGAGGVGENGQTDGAAHGGDGGPGREWPVGSGVYYAGGGGGQGRGTGVSGSGGIGGGGQAAHMDSGLPGQSGTPNTGGGGGGTEALALGQGNGGSGIVIIRYPYDGN